MTINYKLTVTTATFMADVVEASKTTPVLVDFWADWCAPCKQLMPTLERLADEYAGRFVLAKVNADEEQALAQQVGVRSLPTVVLFKNGEMADHFVGVQPEAQIRQLLDRHIPAPQLSPLEQARVYKLAEDYAAALLILEPAIAAEPNSIDLQCEFAEVKIQSGDLATGKQLLELAQSREPNSPAVKRLAALIAFSDVVNAYPDTNDIKQQLVMDSNNIDARHALAVHRLLAGDYDAALEDWLHIMRTHRKYQDDLARKSLVMAFELIGNTDPRVAQARREMARMLF